MSLKITFPKCDLLMLMDEVSRGIHDIDIPHIYAELMKEPEHKIETKFIKGNAVNIWTKNLITCESMPCDWCKRKFKNKIVGVPISVDDQIINGTHLSKTIVKQLLEHKHLNLVNIGLIGCLCSWECALSACTRNPGNYNVKDVKSSEALLRLLHEDDLRHGGKTITELQPMPTPLLMSMFGGPLSTSDYMNSRGKRTIYSESHNITPVTWQWQQS